jgi:hypothetical protein
VVAGEDVEANRSLEVGHIEVAYLLGSRSRYIGEHGLGDVAQGVNQAHPFPASQVLGNHGYKQS